MVSVSPSSAEMKDNMMQPNRILVAARDMLSNPARWSQFCSARNSAGDSVSELYHITGVNPAVVARDIAGTVQYIEAVGQARSEQIADALFEIYEQVGHGNSIAQFNDAITHKELMQMFDKAIAACDAKLSAKNKQPEINVNIDEFNSLIRRLKIQARGQRIETISKNIVDAFHDGKEDGHIAMAQEVLLSLGISWAEKPDNE